MERDDPPRVLIVDDEADLARLYAQQLEDAYDVATANDGPSALAVVEEGVDVVLLDRRMPDTAGEDLLEEIREIDGDVRVAMVTAVVPDFDIIDMDFDDYLLKPVTREELRAKVEGMVIRADYRELVREYFTLTSKYATLRAHKAEAALEESEEFAALEDSLDEIRVELDGIVAEFGPEDFRVMYRDLGTPGQRSS